MVAYLGKPGMLVPFKCPSMVEISSSRPSSEDQAMSGRLVEYRAPESKRVWSVDIGTATPGQVAGLQSLVQGSKPPWVFVEPYAMVTNLLSPEQSVLDPGTWSGAGVIEGGSAIAADGTFAVRTLLHATGGTIDFGFREGVPDRPAVVPGVPVTVSAYVRGSGVLGISWRDWADQTISNSTISYSSTTLARVSAVNRMPPANAAAVRIWVTGATQAALPALTWTPDLPEWALGRGCNRVSVNGLNEAVQLAVKDEPGMRRAGTNFTVRERG